MADYVNCSRLLQKKPDLQVVVVLFWVFLLVCQYIQ